jgi:hypothetical protein
MKAMLIVTGLLALCLIVGVPAYAIDSGDLSVRIQEQQQLLRDGLLTGRLTLAEADIIAYNLNRIINRQAKLLGNGDIPDREMQRLKTLLDHNSAMIAKKRYYGVKKLF